MLALVVLLPLFLYRHAKVLRMQTEFIRVAG